MYSRKKYQNNKNNTFIKKHNKGKTEKHTQLKKSYLSPKMSLAS